MAQPYVKGEFVIIQDADLEYSPKDFEKIINILKKNNKAVYGSRVLNTARYSYNNFTSNMRVFANHMLTIVSNLINKQSLTDAHTCYKAFNSNVFKSISETSRKSFGSNSYSLYIDLFLFKVISSRAPEE